MCFFFVFLFFFFYVSEVKSLFGLKMKPRPLCCVFKNRNHTHTQHSTSTHTTTTKTQISVYLSLRCLQAPSLSSRILIAFQARNFHLPIRTQKGQPIYFVTSAHQNLISLWEITLYCFTFDNILHPKCMSYILNACLTFFFFFFFRKFLRFKLWSLLRFTP